MNWFTWRQHRKQLLIFVVILAVFAVFSILTSNHYWHLYQNAQAACVQNPTNPSCDDISSSLPQSYGVVMRAVYITSLAVPLVLGIFLGSPMLAKEYEEGTNKLAWTQSVSRRKWLSTKLLWALLFAALYGLAVSLLVNWWTRTAYSLYHDRFGAGEFDVQGMMPFAYSIFFTALGFVLSAWFRKTIITMAVTLALFIGFQATFAQVIRAHYMTPIAITAPMGPGVIDDKIPAGAWVIQRAIVDKNSKVFNSFDINNMPADCRALIQQTKGGGIRVKATSKGGDPIDTCLNNAGYHQVAKYQPAHRYWDFQRIETGIYLGLAALAVAATYWLVLRRDA